QLLAGSGIPDVDQFVFAAGQQFDPVRTDRRAVHLPALTRQSVDFLAGRDVPVKGNTIGAGGEHTPSVRRQRHTDHAMVPGAEAAYLADLLRRDSLSLLVDLEGSLELLLRLAIVLLLQVEPAPIPVGAGILRVKADQ